MIKGEVNADRELIVRVRVVSWNGEGIETEATVDTGFSGYLCLPLERIERLQLPFLERRSFALGDDGSAPFDVYAAVVDWDDKERDVFVLAAEGKPGSGTSLLYGYRIQADMVDGGEVIIAART